MEVMIVGAGGQIAQLLSQRLIERGDAVRGVIRSAKQEAALHAAGVRPYVIDIERHGAEHRLAQVAHGVDAVVFAAGAGPGSGSGRKWTVDHLGCVHSAVAAARAEVHRFVVISAMGTDEPPQDDDVFSVYLRAKSQADVHVRGSEFDHTIVRPGRLTDEAPTGRVKAARHVPRGAISRADVAGVLLAVLDDPSSAGRTFEVVGGDAAIIDAVAGLADQHDTLD